MRQCPKKQRSLNKKVILELSQPVGQIPSPSQEEIIGLPRQRSLPGLYRPNAAGFARAKCLRSPTHVGPAAGVTLNPPWLSRLCACSGPWVLLTRGSCCCLPRSHPPATEGGILAPSITDHLQVKMILRCSWIHCISLSRWRGTLLTLSGLQ